MVEYVVTEQTNHNDMETIFKSLIDAVTYCIKHKGSYLYLRVKLL